MRKSYLTIPIIVALCASFTVDPVMDTSYNYDFDCGSGEYDVDGTGTTTLSVAGHVIVSVNWDAFKLPDHGVVVDGFAGNEAWNATSTSANLDDYGIMGSYGSHRVSFHTESWADVGEWSDYAEYLDQFEVWCTQ
jgi:hypothetical protein